MAYQPGTLEAVAYRNGKKIVAKHETTSEAYAIVLQPLRTAINADGKDVTVINVSVTDKQGRGVPDAGNLIGFTFSGDASIIGVGNGDPSSHEPDKYVANWQRNLFNGKYQVILQSGTNTDVIQFKASSPGLQDAMLTIRTVQPGTRNEESAMKSSLSEE